MRRSLLVLLILASPALARAELVDRVAAVVNDQVVTLREVRQRAAPLLAKVAQESPDQQAQDRPRAMRRALDDLIGEKLMDAELKGMNVEVSDQEVNLAIDDVKKHNHITDPTAFAQALRQQGFTVESYHKFMKAQLAKVKLLNIKVKSKIKISDDDVKAAYARMARLDHQDQEIHCRHIIILCGPDAPKAKVAATHARAEQIAKLARQPGADFAQLAKKYSQGRGAPEGGDLGWFARGTLAASFENAAFALKKGQVSDPVRTDYGWHVIKLLGTRHAKAKPFAQVKDQLRARLYQQEVEKRTQSYLAQLRRNAEIDVKIPALRHTDPKDPLTPNAAPSGPVDLKKATVISGPGAKPHTPKAKPSHAPGGMGGPMAGP